MTVVYKKISPGNRTGDEIVIALEKDSNRLLYHQRINSIQKERNFSFPLVFLYCFEKLSSKMYVMFLLILGTLYDPF